MSLDLLLPKARRNKLFLLVREWLMELRSKKGNLGPFNADVANESDASAQGIEHNWKHASRLSVPKTVYDQTSIEYSQDSFDDGFIVTDFSYQSNLLPDATLVSNGVTHVSVYDASGEIVPIFSKTKHIQKKKTHLSLAPIKQVSGLSANLYGNVENTAGNYGHWLIDALARMFLMEQNYSIESIDHFVVPRLRYDFQRDSLIACGIPIEKILEVDTLECISFENLLCVTAPRESSSGVCPSWAIDNYRKRLLDSGSAQIGKTRLYVSRRDANSRNFTNEPELIEVLESHGFEPVELSKHNFAEKIAMFADAECVVGLTGAGMTNLMFCPPNASVLELMPGSNVNYLYSSICGHLNLNYLSLVFHTGDLLSKLNKYQGNLFLDPAVLEANLHDLLGSEDKASNVI